MNMPFLKSFVPRGDELMHEDRRLFCRNRFEANARATVRILLDYVTVLRLILARVSSLRAAQEVQIPNGLLRKGKLRVLFVNELKRVTITTNFFFIPIAKLPTSLQDGLNAISFDVDALNAIRRDRAFD